jgi:hypothetical protein
MTSENKISLDTTLNLDNGQVRIKAVGDQLVITFGGAEIMIGDDEIEPFLLGIRAAANAAGAEHIRQSNARFLAKWGTPAPGAPHISASA